MTDLLVIRACYRSPNKDPAAIAPEVHSLFSSEIRNDCFSRFGVTAAHMVSERHAFSFDAITSTGTCILKVTNPSHRSYEQLEAELELLTERGNRIRKNEPIVDLKSALSSL
jgi:hypothetical protein